jgi:citrate lyase subunit beta/citryl-CoA lyase
MEKAVASGADAVVFDLEDAVPPPELPAARAAVREFLDAQADAPSRLFVRVGVPGTAEVVDDLAAVVSRGLAGILIPMVHDVAQVVALEAQLAAAERSAAVPEGSTVMTPLLETANALRVSYEIATCSDRIAYMGSGISRAGDIARSLGYRWTPEGLETLFFRSWVLMNFRAAGIVSPLSGVWGRVDDLDGLRAFAEQTRQIGYDGLLAIHPSHIPVINEIFTPTADEIAGWRAVISAMEDLHAQGLGTARLDGGLIDYAHVKTARQGLALAAALGVA